MKPRTEPGLPPEQKYRRPALSEECANCGHTFGWHGASDYRCPGEKVAGEWIAAETFFAPLRPYHSEEK